jgi:hypothetical protein
MGTVYYLHRITKRNRDTGLSHESFCAIYQGLQGFVIRISPGNNNLLVNILLREDDRVCYRLLCICRMGIPERDTPLPDSR